MGGQSLYITEQSRIFMGTLVFLYSFSIDLLKAWSSTNK